MNFFYSVQDVKISLERINEIHQMDDENGKEGLKTAVDNPSDGIHIDHIMFKYDPHALSKTIDDVDIHTTRKGDGDSWCFGKWKDHAHSIDVGLLFCIGRKNHYW